MTNRSVFINQITKALGRDSIYLSQSRPELPISPKTEDLTEAIRILNEEVTKLSGEFLQLKASEMKEKFSDLVKRYEVNRAAIWRDEVTKGFGMEPLIEELGINLAAPDADKYVLADCDLGITTADFFIPETGTLGLTSSPLKPRAVSLLPLTHLAIITAKDLVSSLPDALIKFKNKGYLALISGPSRTSDIELILTLGVHGPKNLVVWFVEEG